MKKRKKTKVRSQTSQRSQNAMMRTSTPKKRFGKKEKRKTIIIVILVILAMLGASFATKYFKNKKAQEEWEAKKGEIIERDADKALYDDEGNPIDTSKTTTVHIIDCGDGNATLIKKGNYEVLVDAGADVTEYLEKNISGDLEYLILTNNYDGCISGVPKIYEKFSVINTIYSNPNSTVKKLVAGKSAEEADQQIIDLGENLTVSVKKGLDSDNSLDKTTYVIVKDNSNKFLIAGQSSKADLIANYETDVTAYILGGTPTVENLPLKYMAEMMPRWIVFSTKKQPNTEILEACENTTSGILATYKHKNILFTILPDEVVECNIPDEEIISLAKIEEEKLLKEQAEQEKKQQAEQAEQAQQTEGQETLEDTESEEDI